VARRLKQEPLAERIAVMSSVKIRPMVLSDEDFKLFADCFELNGMPKDVDFLRWNYDNKVVGEVYIDLAIEEQTGRVAAIYATRPLRVKFFDEERIAVQSMDTLTDLNFRGRGLFVSMATSVFERCSSSSVAFVYGFPNGQSAHGFFSRLGWSSLDPLPFMIRPIRPVYFLRHFLRKAVSAALYPTLDNALRYVERLCLPTMYSKVVLREGSHELREVQSFDATYTELWEDFSVSNDIGIAVVRDDVYMNWRVKGVFEGGDSYKTLAVYDVVRDKMLAAVTWIVYSKHGGRVGYIIDLLHRQGEASYGDQLLGHAIQDMISEGADICLAWNFQHSPNHKSFVRNGFFSMPESMRPIELHMGVRPLHKPSQSDALSERSAWYISYCDSDTV
jgi:hypothetical protein